MTMCACLFARMGGLLSICCVVLKSLGYSNLYFPHVQQCRHFTNMFYQFQNRGHDSKMVFREKKTEIKVIYVSQRGLISEYWGGQEGQNYNPWRDVSGGKCFHSFVHTLFPGDGFRRVLLKCQSQCSIVSRKISCSGLQNKRTSPKKFALMIENSSKTHLCRLYLNTICM